MSLSEETEENLFNLLITWEKYHNRDVLHRKRPWQLYRVNIDSTIIKKNEWQIDSLDIQALIPSSAIGH